MMFIKSDSDIRLMRKAGAIAAGAMNCMECGSCSYSCPAKKPLVQSMRAAKAFLREAGANK